jgi:hypothetical protein
LVVRHVSVSKCCNLLNFVSAIWHRDRVLTYMSFSSPPRSYSPLKSSSSEEIAAFPLDQEPRVCISPVPQHTILQVTSDALQSLSSSLRTSSSGASRSSGVTQKREALDTCCKQLVQIAARASELRSSSIRNLLDQIQECVFPCSRHFFCGVWLVHGS